ncbi:predicted protein [Chaetoceros tenuissimus]|uniref:Uncharacterized protein n=1 Tax=Chaetoceros tenuissimus TaxID=426638 RepID=A0AAD3DAU9_9STRA|nr:predicted protein [Chaetoceros tenuissimus]
MVLRFQKQSSGKEAESNLNESENKEESKCNDNRTEADEAVTSSSIPTNPQNHDYSFDEYGMGAYGSESGAFESSYNSNYESNYTDTDFMNQGFDCPAGHPLNDNAANGNESDRNTTDKSSAGLGVLSRFSKKRDAVAAADSSSSSLATSNDALPAKDSDDSSSPSTSNHTTKSGDNDTDEIKLLFKKSKDNHSSDLNQESNLNSNDAMESSTSNDSSLALSNNESEIENAVRKGDGQNATIDSSSFSNDTLTETNIGSNAVDHVSIETSSLKERAQGHQEILANTDSVNVLQVQESDPRVEKEKTMNEIATTVSNEKGNELSAIDSIQKDKEENEQGHQHGHDAPALSAPTNSSPPSDVSMSNVVEKEHSISDTRQNLTILDVNANEQRASHQDMVVAKSIAMKKDTVVNISSTARNSQEDASPIQIGQSSANMENSKTANRRFAKQIENGAKPLSNGFVSPTPRHGGRQHAVVRAFSNTTHGGTRIIPRAPVRGNNVNTNVTSSKSTKNVFQPITPSPPPPSRDTGAKQSDSSSIGTGKAFPSSRSGTTVTSGKAKMHVQLDPKVANKVSTFSSPSLTNAVNSRKTESAMSFDELLQEFTNDLTESGDTVKRSCANLIDLNVKLCTSQSVALRIHAAFDDLLEEAQMLCDL